MQLKYQINIYLKEQYGLKLKLGLCALQALCLEIPGASVRSGARNGKTW